MSVNIAENIYVNIAVHVIVKIDVDKYVNASVTISETQLARPTLFSCQAWSRAWAHFMFVRRPSSVVRRRRPVVAIL